MPDDSRREFTFLQRQFNNTNNTVHFLIVINNICNRKNVILLQSNTLMRLWDTL